MGNEFLPLRPRRRKLRITGHGALDGGERMGDCAGLVGAGEPVSDYLLEQPVDADLVAGHRGQRVAVQRGESIGHPLASRRRVLLQHREERAGDRLGGQVGRHLQGRAGQRRLLPGGGDGGVPGGGDGVLVEHLGAGVEQFLGRQALAAVPGIRRRGRRCRKRSRRRRGPGPAAGSPGRRPRRRRRRFPGRFCPSGPAGTGARCSASNTSTASSAPKAS